MTAAFRKEVRRFHIRSESVDCIITTLRAFRFDVSATDIKLRLKTP